MASAKPGSPHPTRKGLVKGLNGRYVAKSTYNRQVKAKNQKGGPIKKVQSTTDAMNRKRLGRVKQTKAKVGSTTPRRTSGSIVKADNTKPENPRRTSARARQQQAARGTRGSGTKTGRGTSFRPQPRLEAGSKVKTASKVVSKVAKNPITKGFGKVAGPLAAGIGLVSGATDLVNSLRRGEGLARIPKLLKETKAPASAKVKSRGGRRSSPGSKKPTPTPTTPKTTKTPSYKARPVKGPGPKKKVVTPTVTKKQTPKVTTKQTPKVRPTGPAPKTKPTTSGKSAIHTYKAHGSATHVGRYKTLKEHRAAVKARTKPTQKTKVAKPKLPKMSGMVPSLRNYG